MYWLWQNIWQLLLFYKVYVITDYESLFNLQAHLSNYESSVLIRIIYYVISNPSLNMAGLVSCIKLIVIMGIVGLLILAQKYRIIMILNVFKYVWCTIWIVKGMNSASVYLVNIPWWRSHPIHENRATESICTEPCNPLLRATKSMKRATSTY